jgi:uncharacterized protein (DUF697 family)
MSKDLAEMDRQADKIIGGWTFGSLVGNLLPPPFDVIAVGAAFAKMGYDLSKVYEVPMSMGELKRMGVAIAKGIGAVSGAAFIGSSIFKWVPGVNIWVALLIQPPMVAAVTYAAGKTFKDYYHFRINEGRDLSYDELRELAGKSLREKVGK